MYISLFFLAIKKCTYDSISFFSSINTTTVFFLPFSTPSLSLSTYHSTFPFCSVHMRIIFLFLHAYDTTCPFPFLSLNREDKTEIFFPSIHNTIFSPTLSLVQSQFQCTGRLCLRETEGQLKQRVDGHGRSSAVRGS